MISMFRALPATTRGIVLFLVTLFLFSTMDMVAKHLTERYEPFMVVWARYTSQTFWTLLILSPHLRSLFRTRQLGLQILRSVFLFSATILFFTALKFLLLAEAIAIFEIAPLAITVMSVLFLKETVGHRRWIAVIVGFIGAMIIIRPGTALFDPAALLPIGAAICFAAYSISTRFLGSTEHPATSFLYTTLFGTIAASIFVGGFWTPPLMPDIPVLLGMGILGGLGHYCLIVALTLVPASRLAPFTYFGLLFGTVWGYLVFAEFPDRPTIIGAFVIIGAGLYVWRREEMAGATPRR